MIASMRQNEGGTGPGLLGSLKGATGPLIGLVLLCLRIPRHPAIRSTSIRPGIP